MEGIFLSCSNVQQGSWNLTMNSVRMCLNMAWVEWYKCWDWWCSVQFLLPITDWWWSPSQGFTDCQVRGPTHSALSKIFKYFLVLVRSQIFNTSWPWSGSVLVRGSLLLAIGSWVGMPYTRGEMDLLAYEIANADGLDWWDTEYSYGCQKEIYTNISNTNYNDKFGTRFKTIITRLTTDNLLISIETLRNWIGLW